MLLLTVMLAGQLAVGFSSSLTVTVKAQVLVLALASVAVQVTVVAPSGNIEPLAGLQLMLEPGQLSHALAVKFTCAWQSPLRLSAPVLVVVVMLAGHVATGGSLSTTVTVKLQVALWLCASVAVQLTVVVPTGKSELDAGLQLMIAPGQLSLAVAVKFTCAWQSPLTPSAPMLLLTVMLAGQLAVGF